MAAHQRRTAPQAPPVRLEILAYAPTEFFHCLHCEAVFDHVGLGPRVHAEQRASGLLPPDLEREYAAISDWVVDALDRYGARLSVKVVDAASLEGVARALRHRIRRFPAFVINGRERVLGFDRDRLDAVLAGWLGAGEMPSSAPKGR